MSKVSRDKGKRGERMAAALCRALWPSAVRTISQARGAEEADIANVPMHVEVKVGRAPNILGAMRQAKRDSKGAKPVLVIAKRDREEPTVTMTWETFAALWSQANGTPVPEAAMESPVMRGGGAT